MTYEQLKEKVDAETWAKIEKIHAKYPRLSADKLIKLLLIKVEDNDNPQA